MTFRKPPEDSEIQQNTSVSNYNKIADDAACVSAVIPLRTRCLPPRLYTVHVQDSTPNTQWKAEMVCDIYWMQSG